MSTVVLFICSICSKAICLTDIADFIEKTEVGINTDNESYCWFTTCTKCETTVATNTMYTVGFHCVVSVQMMTTNLSFIKFSKLIGTTPRIGTDGFAVILPGLVAHMEMKKYDYAYWVSQHPDETIERLEKTYEF